MYHKLSERLTRQANTVFSVNPACVFKPTIILHNPETGFKFSPLWIDNLDINQNFLGSYMDAIQVTFPVQYTDYAAITANMQDLECTITLYFVDDEKGRELYNLAPIIIKTRAILDDQPDIAKLQNPNLINAPANKPDTPEQALKMISYTIHLIEHTAYDLRHKQINCMTTGVTVEDMLRFVCYQFDVEKVKIVPPKNPQIYSNFVIPPVKGMTDVFSYIQNRYGVYSTGIGWYFTDDTMFVYPMYDTNLENNTADGILRIINVPNDAYAGVNHYHCFVDDDLWIVSNSNKDMKSLNTVGEENAGSCRMSLNSDNMTDGFSSMKTDGTVTVSNEKATVVQMANKKGSMNSKSQNVKFDGTRSNIYVSTSEMAMYNGSVMKVGWKNAIPRAILPGQTVRYCYDDNGDIFSSKKSRVLSTMYSSHELEFRIAGQKCFNFTSEIALFMDPEKDLDE